MPTNKQWYRFLCRDDEGRESESEMAFDDDDAALRTFSEQTAEAEKRKTEDKRYLKPTRLFRIDVREVKTEITPLPAGVSINADDDVG